jgi:hypothetical protein
MHPVMGANGRTGAASRSKSTKPPSVSRPTSGKLSNSVQSSLASSLAYLAGTATREPCDRL